MATESTQKKLSRIRPPRVQITYDVEIGDAIEMKELPFVMGVLSDLSGNPEEALPHPKERKFVEIDRDNFDDVLAGMKPRLTYSVENTLTGDGSKLGVELKFNEIDDFQPERIVNQIEPLRKLLETREKLSDLVAKMDGNDKLVDLLGEILQNTESRTALAAELEKNTGGGEAEAAAAEAETKE